jgi:hypothetical protein
MIHGDSTVAMIQVELQCLAGITNNSHTDYTAQHFYLHRWQNDLPLVVRGSTIFAHNDPAGQAVAERWTEQLKDVATVDRRSFLALIQPHGQPVKDLNDLLRISGDSHRLNAKLIYGVIRF